MSIEISNDELDKALKEHVKDMLVKGNRFVKYRIIAVQTRANGGLRYVAQSWYLWFPFWSVVVTSLVGYLNARIEADSFDEALALLKQHLYWQKYEQGSITQL